MREITGDLALIATDGEDPAVIELATLIAPSVASFRAAEPGHHARIRPRRTMIWCGDIERERWGYNLS